MTGREASARVGHERTDADFDKPWLVQKQHPAAKAVIFVAALFAAACVALHTATFFVVPGISVFILSIAVCASASALVINLAERHGVLRTVPKSVKLPWSKRLFSLCCVFIWIVVGKDYFTVSCPNFSYSDIRETDIFALCSDLLLLLTAIAGGVFITFFCGIRGHALGGESVVVARYIGRGALFLIAFPSFGFSVYEVPFANWSYLLTSAAIAVVIVWLSFVKGGYK